FAPKIRLPCFLSRVQALTTLAHGQGTPGETTPKHIRTTATTYPTIRKDQVEFSTGKEHAEYPRHTTTRKVRTCCLDSPSLFSPERQRQSLAHGPPGVAGRTLRVGP
ncbi:unnamed protein product, partial [Ectocarpus sp. 8 AP-2014]